MQILAASLKFSYEGEKKDQTKKWQDELRCKKISVLQLHHVMEPVHDSMAGRPEYDAGFILDRVDGLSDYGFGDDIDLGDLSDESSEPSEKSGLTAIPTRRVHFGLEVERMNVHGKSTSPSLTRALLPSAQPVEGSCQIYTLHTQQLEHLSEPRGPCHIDNSDSMFGQGTTTVVFTNT